MTPDWADHTVGCHATGPADGCECGATARPRDRYGWTVVRVLPELVGKPWGPIAQAFLRAVRPSEVRLVSADRNGHYITKTDAKCWRVTVYIDASGITDIVQEVEVDLPDGVEHGFDLGERLRKGR